MEQFLQILLDVILASQLYKNVFVRFGSAYSWMQGWKEMSFEI